jgi:hypothetical protein
MTFAFGIRSRSLDKLWSNGGSSAHTAIIGGGYSDRRLSDLPLRWMQDKASALGLGLTPLAVGAENYRGAFTDSYMEFLKGLYAKKNPRHYRSIGATQFGNEVVDRSVQQRRKTDLSYEPQNNGLSKLT